MKQVVYIVISFLCLIPICGIAQVPTMPKDTAKPAPVAITPSAPLPVFPDTNIHVFEQPVVKATTQKIYDFQRYNHGTSPGFRVQIDFGQEKNAVYTVKSNFSVKYPNIPSYVTYKQPYFRVSVGDCRKHLDAVRLLNELKKDYPAAFIVADKITPPPLQ